MAARCTGVVKALGTQQGKRRTQKPFGRLALHGLHVDPEHDLDLGEAAVSRGGARRCRKAGRRWRRPPWSISVRIPTPRHPPAAVSGHAAPGRSRPLVLGHTWPRLLRVRGRRRSSHRVQPQPLGALPSLALSLCSRARLSVSPRSAVSASAQRRGRTGQPRCGCRNSPPPVAGRPA